MRPFATCALLATLAVAPVGAVAGSASGGVGRGIGAAAPLPDPGGSGWEAVEFPRIERTTRYRALPEGGIEALAACSASARVLPLEGVDLARTPVLRWRWRVDEAPGAADERSKAGDDFAARVYVMFRFEPERASWLERARRRVAAALYDTELPGTALSFVWTRDVPTGTRWDNPYASETRMIALAQGPADGWRTEQVDLLRAYRRAFGREPSDAVALGVMTDADDTCSEAKARYADFSLHPRPAEG